MSHLLEVALDGGIRGGAVICCVVEGGAGKGVIVACFDGCGPGGRDKVTSRGMVEMTRVLMLGRLYTLVAWGDDVGGGKGWGWVG